MNMQATLRDQVVFHLTGRRDPADDAVVRGLRPALLARYRRLDSLRYDFPLVLDATATSGEDCIHTLSDLVDAAVRKVVPAGAAGEATRRRALAIERRVRERVAAGRAGSLLESWNEAVPELGELGTPAQRELGAVRDALGVDGELADCDHDLPARFVRHAWAAVQREKATAAARRIGDLIIRLEEVLRADHLRSESGLAATSLQQSFGTAHHGLFDFRSMSGLLARAARHRGIDARRKARIEQALTDLKTQRFYRLARRGASQVVHEFCFDSVAGALAEFRRRLPEVASLLRALSVAELEVAGAYVDGMHDTIVAAIDEQSITPTDLEFFPDYLVLLTGEPAHADDTAHLTEALTSGVPLKVVAQVGDLLEESTVGQARHAYGVRSAQLATAAMGLGDAFVLQTTASNLFRLRGSLVRGLRHRGPALFSVYAPLAGAGDLPPYLVGAAAMQSRALPAFSFDPSAGADRATRFSLEDNPQPERDWPVEALDYADPDLQAVTTDVAFTFVDFALCDPRCTRHFVPVPRAEWSEGMIAADQWLAHPPAETTTAVPFVLAVDDADLLCRLVVDDRLMRAALRCRDAWHGLQEAGGVHDSRLEQAIARERQAWEAEHRPTAEPVVEAAAPAPVEAATTVDAEPARNPDEAYVETVRCSTCNECTTAFPRVFAYDDNKQAYIKDLAAATYRQLVEAAESCQVSVIHPGKPRDPTEPGLDELLERAKPFL